MKLWVSPHIGGQQWKVYLVSPRSHHLKEQGKCLAGKCDYPNCRIYISQAQDPQLREDTLLHELLHAALFVSAADQVYEGDPEKDEVLVAALTPCLHRLLKDLGFKFPAGPNDRPSVTLS